MPTIKVINKSDNETPQYKSDLAAGFDLRASEEKIIMPNETQSVGTGLFFEIPPGAEVQIRPRSGLSLRGITVANSPGTIDADYRGEIKIILYNFGTETFKVNQGDRVAQGVLAMAPQALFEVVGELSETERADGGFGHTGVK